MSLPIKLLIYLGFGVIVQCYFKEETIHGTQTLLQVCHFCSLISFDLKDVFFNILNDNVLGG